MKDIPVPEKLIKMIDQRKIYDVVKFATEHDVFTFLDDMPDLEVLSRSISLDPLFTEYLLNVLVNAGYAEEIEEEGKKTYRNCIDAGVYLSRNSPSYAGDHIFYDADTYDILEEYAEGSEKPDMVMTGFWNSGFLLSVGSKSLMGLVQSAVDCIDLDGERSMLDIGGGHGLYSIFLCKKHPGLNAWVLDLPEVVDAAKEGIEKYGMEGRVDVIASDYRDFKPDRKYDVVFISNLAGSKGELCDVYGSAWKLLEDGGSIVARSFVADAGEDSGSAMAVLDRFTRRRKKGFTMHEIADSIRDAGFDNVRCIHKGDGVAIFRGIKKE